MNAVFRFRAARLTSLLMMAACSAQPDERLVLRADAAAELGLRETAFRPVNASAFPPAAREDAAKVRGAMGGGERTIRFYASDNGERVILIPTRSFEGEDPHVVMGLMRGGRWRTGILRTYAALESYCPAEGELGEGSAARDSRDGCRYFTPVAVPRVLPPPRR